MIVNAKSLVDVINREKPDIVLVDVALEPEEEDQLDACTIEETSLKKPVEKFSGLVCCLHCKSTFPYLPVVLVSSFKQTDVLSYALQIAADGFVYKEGSDDSIQSVVHTALRSSRIPDFDFYDYLHVSIF